MNTDQILSMLRGLLKAVGAGLVTHGYVSSGHLELAIGAILAAAGFICSHYTHADDSATPTVSVKNVAMLALLCSLAPLFFIGCSTTSAYRAESATAITVEKAMAAWNDYVGQYHPSTNVEAKVMAAYNKYKAAELTSIDATSAYSAAKTDTNATTMHAATAALAASLNDLIAVLQSFGIKLTVQPLTIERHYAATSDPTGPLCFGRGDQRSSIPGFRVPAIICFGNSDRRRFSSLARQSCQRVLQEPGAELCA